MFKNLMNENIIYEKLCFFIPFFCCNLICETQGRIKTLTSIISVLCCFKDKKLVDFL